MQLNDRIGRRMKLQDLHVLMTVVQAGSMGKAAERLNTSQPNISRSIAELEHALGVRLLDRHRQGVEPTEYGRALLDCGVTVFDGLRQGLKNIEFLADPATGEVRIGSIIPLAASFVSAVVDRLSRRYPGMSFHIAATEAETLHRELCERNLDLVIIKRIGPFADEQFNVETLFYDSYVVVAGAQHPWARRRRIELVRAGEPVLGAAAAGNRDGRGADGGLPRQRPRLSARDRDHASQRGAGEPAGDRSFPHDFPDVCLALRGRAAGAQGLARRAADCPGAGRHRHAEEPHARARSRGCSSMPRVRSPSRSRRRMAGHGLPRSAFPWFESYRITHQPHPEEVACACMRPSRRMATSSDSSPSFETHWGRQVGDPNAPQDEVGVSHYLSE